MKYISPNVEWRPQEPTIAQHIANVGRICYKASGKQPSEGLSDDEKFAFFENRDRERCKSFWKSGHRSMFRHGSVYVHIKNSGKLPRWIWSVISSSPYIHYAVSDKQVFISTNMQYFNEHGKTAEVLDQFIVSEDDYIKKALEAKCKAALMLLRMTFVVTTQISSSRELNRTSPNVIAEQSTRYVDMKKKGGVQICRPHWMEVSNSSRRFSVESMKELLRKAVFGFSCKIAEWSYRMLLRLDLKPQDARGVLPLDTYTVVAYTYNINEWQHILDLRYHGTTGEPHPNAKIVASRIHSLITARMSNYIDNFSI